MSGVRASACNKLVHKQFVLDPKMVVVVEEVVVVYSSIVSSINTFIINNGNTCTLK